MFLSDAVAIPGFGNHEFVPVASDAVTVQSADGATSLVLQDGHITLNAATVTINHSGGQQQWP